MSALDQLATRIEQAADVRHAEPLSRHTTFGVGGPADLFATVRDADGLAAAVRAATELGVPWFILGSGSNIVVSDAGIRGLVIDNRARTATPDGAGFAWRVESGASFAGFARRMCREGRDGLAWAVGIPGTIGGAVVYNAGAYGGCLADVLTAVRLQEPGGEPRWADAAELELAYRASAFTRRQLEGTAVLEVELALQPGDASELLERAAGYDRRRLDAQPRGRNAGSMFKNPPEHPAWKLIDEVGMRGMRRGGAAISEKHTNFFLNLGEARAHDVAWLAGEAERRVRERFGVQLQREVAFVGEWA